MTAVFRTRQRAEEFAALVDGATTPLRTVHAGHDSEIDRLVGIVQTMRREAADERAVPREAFTVDLRERLMTEAEISSPRQGDPALPPHPGQARAASRRGRVCRGPHRRHRRHGRSRPALAAGRGALPDQARHRERPGRAVHLSGGTGAPPATQAGDRLDEVQGEMAAGPATSSTDPGDAGRVHRPVAQGRRPADGSYADNSDPKTIATLRDFTAHDLTSSRQSRTPHLPREPALRKAVTSLAAIDSRAAQACPSCSDLPTLKVPKNFLVAGDVDRAMHALGSSHLNNDHPVIAPRDEVERADSDQPGATASRSPSAPLPSGAASSGPSSGATSGAGSGSVGWRSAAWPTPRRPSRSTPRAASPEAAGPAAPPGPTAGRAASGLVSVPPSRRCCPTSTSRAAELH